MNRIDELRLLNAIYPEQMTTELKAELAELKADYFFKLRTGNGYRTTSFENCKKEANS
jgi:hypothetical protein